MKSVLHHADESTESLPFDEFKHDTSYASKVFGSIVANDEDAQSVNSETNSLSYSPSPAVHNKKNSRRAAIKNKNLNGAVPKALKFEPDGKENIHSSSYNAPSNNHEKNNSKTIPQNNIESADKDCSVNQTLNAARHARKETLKDKMLESNRLREERRLKKEEGISFREDTERTRLEVLKLRRQLSSKISKAKADRQRAAQQTRINHIEKESHFKSEVFRDHKNTLKETEAQRKRISMEVRAKIRRENRSGQKKMQMAKIEEDLAIIDERHMSSIAIVEAKEAKAESRRMSFQFRNGDAHRIRQLFERVDSQKRGQEHESLKLKWEGERDAETYKKKLEEDRRNSFAFRNKKGKEKRELVEDTSKQIIQEEHTNFELKWEGERDAEAYRSTVEEDRRNSFANRNEEGKNKREFVDGTDRQNKQTEHESFELKWEGERDAEAYKKKLEEDRRNSFAFRNEEAKKKCEFVEETDKQNKQTEHESFELKWEGERDAEAYKKKLEEDRRNSFAFRNEEAKKKCDFVEETDKQNKQTEHESFELKWEGERDAEAYRKKLDEDRRHSFANRNEEAKKKRDFVEGTYRQNKQTEHESFELKWEGERDAEAYRNKVEKGRRNSFANRNEEGKNKREFVEGTDRQNKQTEHESFELKWEGERDAEAYKKKLEEDRRNSFAFRNEEAKKKCEFVKETDKQNKQTKHESFELKWEGERDAEAYRKKLDEDRRNSFALRSEEGIRHLEAMRRVETERQNTEHISYELKWEGEKDAENYKKQMENEKRLSFELRNSEGKRQRDVIKELNKEQELKEHEGLELKWAGDKDADDYSKKMEQERRESFAFRNNEGKRQKDVIAQLIRDERCAEYESYELKWDGEKDADIYKKKLDNERRQSFLLRNKEGKRRNDVSNQLQAEERQTTHESYELKWAGEKDAEAYKTQTEENRRQSFAFRNKDGAKQKAVMEELLSLARERETESIILKWAGEDDAKRYLKEEEEKKRESLDLRNEEAKHHREMEANHKFQQVVEAAEEEELQAACHRDINKYKDQCAERNRVSLQFRRNEAIIQRTEEERRIDGEQELEQTNRNLDEGAQQDVAEYINDCKRRKRLSLAYRAKEKRCHAEWKRNEDKKKRVELSKEVRYRALDSRYVQLAKEEERARNAMDALRHAGCAFAINPFSSLLD